MTNKFYTHAYKTICIIFLIFFILFSNVSYCDDVENDEEYINMQSELDNSISTQTSSNVNTSLNLNSRSCVVIDRLSNNILYGKNETNKVKMASTTKIMTATIIIENCDLKDTVEISKKAAGTGGSRLGLKTGDKISVNDLLYGLMLRSGNDAAVALAEHCAGSIENFSTLMNNKASELNLQNTHFESPHGLDSDGHYTTAYELALLSNYALKNPTFLNIVGTKTTTITINGYSKDLSNTNELLGTLNGVYGIKTGFTNGANRCLVTACKRGNLDIICVVLGSDTKNFRTKDSIKLIEYTFSNYTVVNLQSLLNTQFEEWKQNNINSFSINKGVSQNISLKLCELNSPCKAIKNEYINNISVQINCEKSLDSPIFKNTVIGNITIKSDNTILDNCNIYSENDIDKKNLLDYFYYLYSELGNTLNYNLL